MAIVHSSGSAGSLDAGEASTSDGAGLSFGMDFMPAGRSRPRKRNSVLPPRGSLSSRLVKLWPSLLTSLQEDKPPSPSFSLIAFRRSMTLEVSITETIRLCGASEAACTISTSTSLGGLRSMPDRLMPPTISSSTELRISSSNSVEFSNVARTTSLAAPRPICCTIWSFRSLMLRVFMIFISMTSSLFSVHVMLSSISLFAGGALHISARVFPSISARSSISDSLSNVFVPFSHTSPSDQRPGGRSSCGSVLSLISARMPSEMPPASVALGTSDTAVSLLLGSAATRSCQCSSNASWIFCPFR
mmetsp:Transcript_43300/g.122508  ORF Transcript_43300/g.122508 Transcript_43300/m.122508 type:complete len:303 (-) Transcript_43300:753-1661(-)